LGKPAYRQVKFAIPTGFVESTIDGLLQAKRDTWYSSLTMDQRIGRVLIVSAETYVIDRISTVVLKITPAGMGGKIAATYITSQAAQDFIQDKNHNIFNFFELGVYP
jgi:hypothetical protein